ncbi:hypothetical protein SD80_013875 [Scytonema tolypothrichoides VB-61278]|nr:hypothetical protein SD80_013875 [Scytonema tolypothrichoides VB-61278]
MKKKHLIASTLSLFTAIATLNITLGQSVIAQTSSAVTVGHTKIASGSTTPGATNWQPYTNPAYPGWIYVDIDTSEAKFTTTPQYTISIGDPNDYGAAAWTLGTSTVYLATPTGFRVYLRLTNESGEKDLTPEKANQYKWQVNWIGIGK